MQTLFKKLGVDDDKTKGPQNFQEKLREAFLKKVIVEVKREVGDDAEVLKMIRGSPDKKDDQMIRRYSKIQTPSLGLQPPAKQISRL